MGCAQMSMIESRKLISLPAEIVNQYIDKFPALILQKLKQKFELYAHKSTKQQTIISFIQMYSKKELNQETLKRIYIYFTDNQPKNNLKFRQFILKYAILTKSQPTIFLRILFQIYIDHHESHMNQDQYINFVKNENKSFNFMLDNIQLNLFPINCDTFVTVLKQFQKQIMIYQQKFILTSQEDVPFSAINQELLDCDFNDLVQGRQYYILSNAWFYRWSYYYQEVNHSLQLQKIKSTKMLLNEPLSNSKRRRKRQSSQRQPPRNSSDLRLLELGNSLIEQPKYITFQDIEGQYKGQLKQNIKASTQIKIITDKLWNLLISLHPPQQQFKRMAFNYQTLQFYPKSIYYAEVNQAGDFIISSQDIKKGSVNRKLEELFDKLPSNSNFSIFHKNFGQRNWRQVQKTKKFGQISLQPRYLLVLVPHKQKFIEKHYRKQINKQNLQIGDEIYTHFAFVKNHSSAYILRMVSNKIFKIHFKGYSYRYEIEVNIEDITIKEEQAIQSSAKKKYQSIFKGISNIGNTCFINSIIQCLIATPVLQDFLLTYSFQEKKQPLGYALAAMAKCLLGHEKANPTEFKKIIDINMPIFSGYDQHDAQQFLNLLLDKLSQQIPQKPTIIDYLFGGKTKSKLVCNSCKAIKYIKQKMYILSLPIPQPQFNFYNIIIVPITSKSIKKMTFRLHRTATISQYIKSFQQRTGQHYKDYLFCQSTFNSLKRIKSELTNPEYQNKKIIDLGITPNVALTAFQKLPSKFYIDLLSEKTDNKFKDYLYRQNFWTICSISDKKQKEKQQDKVTIQILNQQNDVEKIKITLKQLKQRTTKIGNKSSNDISYKKMILRKHNSVLKKLQNFGIPKWASYNEIIKIVERYMVNLKSDHTYFNRQDKNDYIIRLLDPSKVRCIFCLKQNQSFNLTDKQLQPCCHILEKNTPLAFTIKNKSYWIYIDWLDFTKCNYMFCSYLQIDQLSKNAENSREQIQVNLQECISLHNQSQQVQMECDKCKFKSQNLSPVIEHMSNIQVFHMKEFRYTPQGHLIKLDLRLKWQQFIDTSKISLNSQGKIYELFAVVKHTGNSHSGHYVCMSKRKHPFQNKRVWVNFDDDVAEIMKIQEKYIDDAYLLFYKKVDMPTSSLIVYSDLLNK